MGFVSWLRYWTNVARRSTKLCMMFGCLLGWCTMYTFSGFLPLTEFCLCIQVLRSPILAVLLDGIWVVDASRTAALSTGRHLYSAGRPSRWASAHILGLCAFWHCWLVVGKSIWPVKIERWGAGVVICLKQGANDSHMVQLMSLPPRHFLLH